MSRHNKVNPDHYKTAGRLTPDDLAREQRKQRSAPATRDRKVRITKPPGRRSPPAAGPRSAK